MRKIKIGIVGCGNISDIYLKNCTEIFDNLEVVGCADLIIERAREKAEKYNIKAYSVQELINHEDIEIIVNLTIPKAHKEVSMGALEAGKHTYMEKPLSLTREDGKALINKAKEKGLKIGGAPDTFLGGGIQTCIELINNGEIGTPIGATAFMTCHGHESWHPDPEFYYKIGGGPMFDMGPYYLTALITMLGSVKRVSGSTKISFPERIITSEPKKGEIIKVDVPTHISGLLDFENGAVGIIITSFDVWGSNLPIIEIYGTKGTLSVPDPNTFSGPVNIKKSYDKEFHEVVINKKYTDNSRGLGISDMANSIINNHEHRANGDLIYHVLDIMHAFHDSSNTSKHITLQSSYKIR